jgi:hypothetical protein
VACRVGLDAHGAGSVLGRLALLGVAAPGVSRQVATAREEQGEERRERRRREKEWRWPEGGARGVAAKVREHVCLLVGPNWMIRLGFRFLSFSFFSNFSLG